MSDLRFTEQPGTCQHCGLPWNAHVPSTAYRDVNFCPVPHDLDCNTWTPKLEVVNDFQYKLGEYLHEAYRRGVLDGEDKADDIEPTRWFDEEAVAAVAAELSAMVGT